MRTEMDILVLQNQILLKSEQPTERKMNLETTISTGLIMNTFT